MCRILHTDSVLPSISLARKGGVGRAFGPFVPAVLQSTNDVGDGPPRPRGLSLLWKASQTVVGTTTASSRPPKTAATYRKRSLPLSLKAVGGSRKRRHQGLKSESRRREGFSAARRARDCCFYGARSCY